MSLRCWMSVQVAAAQLTSSPKRNPRAVEWCMKPHALTWTPPLRLVCGEVRNHQRLSS